MARTKKIVDEDTDPPEWFDPWISSKLYIPTHPSYTSKILNKHVFKLVLETQTLFLFEYLKK